MKFFETSVRPVKKLSMGLIRAAIWEHEATNGTRPTTKQEFAEAAHRKLVGKSLKTGSCLCNTTLRRSTAPCDTIPNALIAC